MVAAKNDYVDAMSLLVKFGGNIYSKDGEIGFAALHWAVYFGMVRAVRYLIFIGEGTQPGVINDRVRYFQDDDAETSYDKSCDDFTALHIVARKQFSSANAMILKILLRNGAVTIAKNRAGETPFDVASCDSFKKAFTWWELNGIVRLGDDLHDIILDFIL